MSGYSEKLNSALAQRRYEKIASIVECTVKKDRSEIFTLSDMLDQVLLNKYLGIPVFLTLLWTMFQFAFAVSEPFVVLIEKVFEVLGTASDQAISDPHLASFVSVNGGAKRSNNGGIKLTTLFNKLFPSIIVIIP
ncbi:MAG: hypothetical protein HPY61_12965 [Methanotrichaceae archaeon]|nr:hypothetical protein [Methanotrichaceae archaeon]